MNFTCDKCHRRYSIADDKIRGRAVKIRCKNCQNVISIQGPSEERTTMMSIADVEKLRAQKAPATAPRADWENESTRSTPALDMNVDWFAMIKGKQVGPLKASALVGRISAGEVSIKTYMWRKGMGDWKRASDIPELMIFFAREAPPARPVAPAITVPAASAPPPTNGAPARRKTGTFSVATPIAPAPSPAPARVAAPIASVGPDAVADDLASLLGDRVEAPKEDSRAEPAFDLGADIGVELGGPNVEAPGAIAIDMDPLGRKKNGAAEAGPPTDPFKALTGGVIDPSKLPPPGESTSFFIAQAGVNKRNPPWKIALFVVSLIAIPVAALYALSTLKVVPLEVVRVDESGNEVKEPFFSAAGAGELRDRLLGRKKPPAEKPVQVARTSTPKKEPSSPVTSTTGTAIHPELPKGLSSTDVKNFYADQQKTDVGPKVRVALSEPPHEKGGELSPDQISKVVDQAQSGIQNCIEQGLKRNPNFKGGKVVLTLTVGSSGTVKHAEIDRAEMNRSDIGECVKDRARRMVFPTFSGDEVTVELPMFLGVTL